MRMSALTLTDQKFLSLDLSSLWKLSPGLAGFNWRSNAVVLTAFCSSPLSRARLSVKVSEMRKSIQFSLSGRRQALWPVVVNGCQPPRRRVLFTNLELREQVLRPSATESFTCRKGCDQRIPLVVLRIVK